ncbi:MAG: DNA polymerase III subunit beta [Myxococcales bacterium]|nr:DNA polymerase III subunit beta [Myxococcales bacterium]
MEFVVNKREFVKALSRVQSVADKRSPMPILTNVLIRAEASGAVHFAATDLLLAVTGTMRADVKKAGSVALPARHIFDTVKALPEGEVTLTVEKNFQARIKGARRRFDLAGAPGEDFPSLPEVGNVPMMSLPAEDIAELIALTSFSMSTDDTRPHLAAALFETHRAMLRMVTTDGHRLSKAERSVSGVQTGSKLLIPAKAIHELRRLVDEARSEKREDGSPAMISLGAASSQGPVFFQRDGMTMSSKLVDAAFPSYEQVIPTSTDRSVRVSRQALLEALRAVSLVSADRTFGVKLSITPGRMVITSENPEIGAGMDEIDATLTGPDVVIGFNSKYVIDVLSSLSCDEVVLDLSGELDPGVVRPEGRTDYIGVIMPMRI